MSCLASTVVQFDLFGAILVATYSGKLYDCAFSERNIKKLLELHFKVSV